MPYDPRLVSEGGNRGIDDQFSRRAPEGKFRVIGVDTFDGTDWVEGDFDTLAQAISRANEKASDTQMLKMYVYDDRGAYRYDDGTF